MYTNTDKAQKTKRESNAHTVFDNATVGKSTYHFVDNRAGAIVQRKLLKKINNSPQTQQAIQLQKNVRNYQENRQKPVQKKEDHSAFTKSNEPIQLCAQDPSCPNSDPCPKHYSQAQDPSLKPFLKVGENFVGQSAMEKQAVGKTPTASDVRVRAKKTEAYQRGGAGLDEGLPTDQRGVVATATSDVPAGIQSGLRGATDLAVLATDTGVATGHTNMFPKLVGGGSTNTTGQANAHDRRRGALPPAISSMEAQVLETTRVFTSSLATGPQILTSDAITGGVPNLTGASPLKPPTTGGVAPGPQRLQVAKGGQSRREHMKDRASSVASAAGLPRPVSPERSEIRDDQTGGTYVSSGPMKRPRSPVPQFGGTNPMEVAANASAWISGPLRHGSMSVTKPKKCTNCGHNNEAVRTNCHACKNSI